MKINMNLINRWILPLLLLGHFIAGVNRDVLSPFAENLPFGELLSQEALKILHSRFKQSVHDHVDNSLSRRTRSLSTSHGLVCPPFDSCVDRCGEPPRALPYTCNCDPLCTVFADCCVDYGEFCRSENNAAVLLNRSLSLTRLKCEILFSKYNLVVVSECPKGYEDFVVKKMCSLKLPNVCSFRDNITVNDADEVFTQCKDLVQRRCMDKFRHACDSKVEAVCTLVKKKCYRQALSTCRRCDKSYWPVTGQDGFIYRNSYCARCNSQTNNVIVDPHTLNAKLRNAENLTDEYSVHFSRQCIPVNVDTCPESESHDDMENLCYSHSGAVMTGPLQKQVSYKNIYCALCNGKDLKSLRCATMESIMQGLIRPLFDTFITGDGEGMKFDEIPAAFSILLNFGLDGRERMLFSSDGEEEVKRHQDRCGHGKIWDPFSEVCRRLYCSTEFVLVDYRCVRRENASNDEDFRNKSTAIIPDARSDFVHLTLTAEMELLDFLQFHGQDIDGICKDIRKSLAKSFEINIQRIRDVNFNISIGNCSDCDLNEILRLVDLMDDYYPISFKIDFNLYEDSVSNVTVSEPSVDSIVSMLASSLSMNGFEFEINNLTSRIFEIHQTVSPLDSWCLLANGEEKKEYWNSDFSLVLNEDNETTKENKIKGIYVNKTGRFYSQGKFVVAILFQGYQFSSNLINVSGVAVVCNEAKLNETCIRILLNNTEHEILENDTLFIYNESLRDAVDSSIYERTEDNNTMVCLKPLKTTPNSKMYNLEIDRVEAMVSFVLLWISVVALVVVLITYISFESLRNLPGCNTVNLTLSLIAMQITFLFGQKEKVTGDTCRAVGHLLHYEILSCFMWMNIMAFDLFRTFGNKNVLSNIRSKRKYLPIYMFYAYFSPVAVILTASLLDRFVSESEFAPHYGQKGVCWIASRNSALVFFALPLAVVMCINLILFFLTIRAMKSVKSLSDINDHQTSKNVKNDLFLYGRMALVIGLTWTLCFIAAYVKQIPVVGRIFTYLFIVFNTLQGLFIFWVFVCNKKVYELYKEAFRKLYRKASKNAIYRNSPATISRFKKAMKRTTSSNTVVSTLSNASTTSSESRLFTLY